MRMVDGAMRSRQAVGARVLDEGSNAVLPSQFFAPRIHAAAQAEKRLMLAVLESAVRTLGRRAAAPELVFEARRWVASDDARWPYSFVNICEALAIDAGCLRRGVLGRSRSRGDRGARVGGLRRRLAAAGS